MTRLIQYATEALTAAVIVGAPFYGSWIYFAVTGNPLQF